VRDDADMDGLDDNVLWLLSILISAFIPFIPEIVLIFESSS